MSRTTASLPTAIGPPVVDYGVNCGNVSSVAAPDGNCVIPGKAGGWRGSHTAADRTTPDLMSRPSLMPRPLMDGRVCAWLETS